MKKLSEQAELVELSLQRAFGGRTLRSIQAWPPLLEQVARDVGSVGSQLVNTQGQVALSLLNAPAAAPSAATQQSQRSPEAEELKKRLLSKWKEVSKEVIRGERVRLADLAQPITDALADRGVQILFLPAFESIARALQSKDLANTLRSKSEEIFKEAIRGKGIRLAGLGQLIVDATVDRAADIILGPAFEFTSTLLYPNKKKKATTPGASEPGKEAPPVTSQPVQVMAGTRPSDGQDLLATAGAVGYVVPAIAGGASIAEITRRLLNAPLDPAKEKQRGYYNAQGQFVALKELTPHQRELLANRKLATQLTTYGTALQMAGGMLGMQNNPTLNAISQGLSMAGMGMAVGGPIGGIVGGLVGFVSGLFGSKKQDKQKEEQRWYNSPEGFAMEAYLYYFKQQGDVWKALRSGGTKSSDYLRKGTTVQINFNDKVYTQDASELADTISRKVQSDLANSYAHQAVASGAAGAPW